MLTDWAANDLKPHLTRTFKLSNDPHFEGSFSSVRELESSIATFLALRNAQPTRHVWNAKGEDILNKIQRAREAMASQAGR